MLFRARVNKRVKQFLCGILFFCFTPQFFCSATIDLSEDINLNAKTRFIPKSIFSYRGSSLETKDQFIKGLKIKKFIYKDNFVTTSYFDDGISVSMGYPIDLKSEAEFISFSSQLYDWLKTILIDPLPRKEIFLAELTHWHQKFVSYTGKPLAEWYTGDLTEWRPFEEGRVSRIDLDYDASKQEEHLSNSIDGFFSKNPFGCDEQYLHQIQGWTIQYKRISAHCFYPPQTRGPGIVFYNLSVFSFLFFIFIPFLIILGFLLRLIMNKSQKRKLKGQT